MHTETTINIQRSRIAQLVNENNALRRELQHFRATEQDYSLGGHEWVDPATGRDTWREGAD